MRHTFWYDCCIVWYSATFCYIRTSGHRVMYECIAAIQGCWWVWITIRNDSCWVLLEDIVPLHLVCQTVTTLPFLIFHWINVENAWLDVTLTSIGWADECHNYCLKDDICALQFYPSACVSYYHWEIPWPPSVHLYSLMRIVRPSGFGFNEERMAHVMVHHCRG